MYDKEKLGLLFTAVAALACYFIHSFRMAFTFFVPSMFTIIISRLTDEGFKVSNDPEKTVAVVTGANKGIGLAIVEKLCQILPRGSATVILTARNVAKGEAAAEALRQQGLNPIVRQLDITDKQSVKALKTFIKENYPDQLQCIINNAGVHTMGTKEPFATQARSILDTNYYGTKRVIDELLPLLRPGGRIVCVSSREARVAKLKTKLRKKLLASDLSADGLSELMENFAKAAAKGKHKQEGWPDTAYAASKLGVTQLCRYASNKARVHKRTRR
jgi:NAD(P)-dependent dehydrogenase (short-subunit alcohol dehydrogenase family)